ncbi:MAG: hypothetical protein R3C44_22300 [Chloroflexota bacterium]
MIDTYAICTPNNSIGWIRRTVDIRAYSGQSIRFRIQVETNDTLNSYMFVDDVSFVTGP